MTHATAAAPHRQDEPMLLIPVRDAIIWFAAISAGAKFLHRTALGPLA
jgi:hypothetical protein